MIDARALTFARGTWGNAVNGQTCQQEEILTVCLRQEPTYAGDPSPLRAIDTRP